MTSTIDRAVEHFGGAVAALGSISKRAKAAQQLLALLGWDLPPGVNDIGLAQLDVALLATRLDELTTLRSQPGVSDADLALAIAGVVDAVATSIDDIDTLVDSFELTPDYLSTTHIADEFFDRIANLLLIHAIGSVVPAAVPAATLLGVFEFTHMPADPAVFQVEHVRQVVRWDRLGMLFTDPSKLLTDVYGWGSPTSAAIRSSRTSVVSSNSSPPTCSFVAAAARGGAARGSCRAGSQFGSGGTALRQSR